MTPESIDGQAVRLRTLWIETATTETRQVRRVSEEEHAALGRVLDELHRLHLAISIEVREHRQTRERAKKARANRHRTHDLKPGRPTAPGKKVRR